MFCLSEKFVAFYNMKQRLKLKSRRIEELFVTLCMVVLFELIDFRISDFLLLKRFARCLLLKNCNDFW